MTYHAAMRILVGHAATTMRRPGWADGITLSFVSQSTHRQLLPSNPEFVVLPEDQSAEDWEVA